MADYHQFKAVATSIQRKLEPFTESNEKRPSIYKVPEYIRKVNKECYEPKVVSIGPIYYRNKSLDHCQKIKLEILKLFLLLIGKHKYGLKECFNVIKGSEEKARRLYQHEIDLTSNEFIEMLMIDAAFIISTFIVYYQPNLLEGFNSEDQSLMFRTMTTDLFLVENQLPFFVVNDLYNAVLREAIPGVSFDDLTTSFMGKFVRFSRFIMQKEKSIEHLVGFLRTFHYLPSRLRRLPKSTKYTDTVIYPPTVKELKAAGVKFVATTSERLLDITFSKGVLKIPKLSIDDSTEAIFRNIIFLEQSHYYFDSYFVDYMIFLDDLIDNPEDMQILVRNKIIENFLGSDEEATSVINSLVKNVAYLSPNFYYHDICVELSAYASKRRNRWCAILRRDYFNHPWSIISMIYLVILLILTVLQVYTGFKQLT